MIIMCLRRRATCRGQRIRCPSCLAIGCVSRRGSGDVVDKDGIEFIEILRQLWERYMGLDEREGVRCCVCC